MVTKYGRIKLKLSINEQVHPDTIKEIMTHLEHNKVFSLTTPEFDLAMVYFPAELMARHTGGEVFAYNEAENFIDGIALTLLGYPVFVSNTNFAPKSKILISGM